MPGTMCTVFETIRNQLGISVVQVNNMSCMVDIYVWFTYKGKES